MKALVLVCALAGTAGANTYMASPEPEEQTHDRLFGFRVAGGEQVFDDRELTMMSLALAVEHRVTGDLRIVGEYEHVWLGVRDTEEEQAQVTDGSGHRASLVARYPLFRTRRLLDGLVRFYADVEVGGGFMLASEPMTGTITAPHGLVGVRLGYDFIKLRKDTRASAVWEPEVLVRAIATPHEPIGYLIGVGMAWGN